MIYIRKHSGPTNAKMHGSAHGKVGVCSYGRIPSFTLNNGSSVPHMAAKTTVFRFEFLRHLDVSGWLALGKGTWGLSSEYVPFLLLSPLGSGSNQEEILQRGEQQDRWLWWVRALLIRDTQNGWDLIFTGLVYLKHTSPWFHPPYSYATTCLLWWLILIANVTGSGISEIQISGHICGGVIWSKKTHTARMRDSQDSVSRHFLSQLPVPKYPADASQITT